MSSHIDDELLYNNIDYFGSYQNFQQCLVIQDSVLHYYLLVNVINTHIIQNNNLVIKFHPLFYSIMTIITYLVRSMKNTSFLYDLGNILFYMFGMILFHL
ncbi:hypothetical protein HPP92_004583 [Vanilla planifolia]|uniref:Uncharacterized protein n=1 Tax=Vanilla planifolia TaxID=51239 RepID=A0A835RQM0_VANPL|nr:hypothetical protein HPP92_004583 [Vanilla planifolia]